MKRVVDALNKALALDHEAVYRLCEKRVQVSDDIADSDLPFVSFQGRNGRLSMGFIGVLSGCLNAALALPDNVRLCALYESDDIIREFYFIETVKKTGTYVRVNL